MFLEKTEYGDIFDARGASYHAAMERFPLAREHEFRMPLELLSLARGQTIVDLPSGGGYLSHFLPDDMHYLCVESSQVFHQFCQRRGLTAYLMEDDQVALNTGSVDRLISIAGLHHIEDKQTLFSEMRRMLKVKGKVCIADVEEDSAVAHFLDEFVGRHTATGHQGLYLHQVQTKAALASAGFDNVEHRVLKYYWRFSTVEDMIWYCKNIFALDASDNEVIDGLTTFLGVREKNGAVLLNWQLLCFVANK